MRGSTMRPFRPRSSKRPPRTGDWWRGKEGDVAAALKGAQRTLEAVYELPLLAHATMEPMNCTADVRADRCDLYVGTQVQQSAQAAAAAAAGLQPNQVNVNTTLLGGGFGRRLDVDFIPAAVEASKAVGAPVKLIWTREDDMTHDIYRPPAREEMSAGFDARGKLVAWRLHITSPSITARARPDRHGSVRFRGRICRQLSLRRAEFRARPIRARKSASTWATCVRSATRPIAS